MSVVTVELGTLTACLDPMTGAGLLVVPPASEDIPPITGCVSLQAAEWNAAMRKLDAMGWEPTEGEHGELVTEGTTEDGRVLVGLYGREPVVSDCPIETEAKSWASVLVVARCQ